MLEDIHTKGFYIKEKLFNRIDESIIHDFKSQLDANNVCIFNQDWDNNDMKRSQCNLEMM